MFFSSYFFFSICTPVTGADDNFKSNRNVGSKMDALRLSHPFMVTANTLKAPPFCTLSLSTLPRRCFKVEAASTNKNNQPFDAATFEAERLALDAEARQAMAEAADPKAWKWVIRKRIWDLMEARNFANNPRPVHHRIPNFVGASVAAQKVFIPQWKAKNPLKKQGMTRINFL